MRPSSATAWSAMATCAEFMGRCRKPGWTDG
jgi:hypothetical protein